MVRVCKQFSGCVVLVVFCSLTWADTGLRGPYLGQTPPGMEPQIFAPGVVSIPNRSEWIGSFSPDGKEFYFTISNPDWTVNSIMVTSQVDGVWSTPTVASFSGPDVDWTVLLSPDGQRLFFTSSRPDYSWLTFDVWMCERQGALWSNPVKLSISSPPRDYAGTCTENGTLYFASDCGGPMSLYKSVPVDGEYVSAERLPSPIYAGRNEQCPWIAPDESYLIFASSRQGAQDLYISYRNQDDSWQEPVNLGFPINTQDTEWNPTVSPDGQYLFYGRSPDSSNENLDLYWVETKVFLPDPHGPIHNLNSEQRFSSIRLAINYAHVGDVLVIEPGVYNESIILEKDIALQSIDPNDPYYVGGTIIQADPNEPVVTLAYNKPACLLEGLTLRAGSVGIMGTGTNATLRNCRIMDNTTHGMELSKSSAPTLDHCMITANGHAGIMMHMIQGRHPMHCQPMLHHCAIVDNGEGSLIDGQPVIVDSFIEGQ